MRDPLRELEQSWHRRVKSIVAHEATAVVMSEGRAACIAAVVLCSFPILAMLRSSCSRLCEPRSAGVIMLKMSAVFPMRHISKNARVACST